MREAEFGLERLGQRRAQERASVVPAALVEGQRPHPGSGQRRGEPEAVQDTRGVRADLDAGANLTEGRRPLVDVDVVTTREQRQGGGQPADPTPDDADAHI
jgi:hypothetical protein